MKRQEKQKLFQTQPAQLTHKLEELTHQCAKTKLALKAGKEKDLHAARKLARDIAIIKTILSHILTKPQPTTK